MNHALYCMGDPSEDIYCQHYKLYERKYKNQQQDLILNSVFLEINNWCISTTFIQSPIIKDLGILPWVFLRRHIWSGESLRSEIKVGKKANSAT